MEERMIAIQIKVLKKCQFHDFQLYINTQITPCPVFQEDQVFVTKFDKPVGFCDWAWNDIRPFVASLLAGGNFSKGFFQDWMKDDNTIIACCTDGVRPVIFEIKRIVND